MEKHLCLTDDPEMLFWEGYGHCLGRLGRCRQSTPLLQRAWFWCRCAEETAVASEATSAGGRWQTLQSPYWYKTEASQPPPSLPRHPSGDKVTTQVYLIINF